MDKVLVIKYDSDIVLPDARVRLIVPVDLGNKLSTLVDENIILTLLDPTTRAINKVGSLVRIENVVRTRNKYFIDLIGVNRITITNDEINDFDRFTYANFEIYPFVDDLTTEQVKDYFESMQISFTEIKNDLTINTDVKNSIKYASNINDLITKLFPVFPVNISFKQKLLEMHSKKEYIEMFYEHFMTNCEQVKFKMKSAREFNEKNNDMYRKMMLKDQIRKAQEELDSMDGNASVVDKLEQQIQDLQAPEYVIDHITNEYNRYKSMDSSSHEYQTTKKYLETLVTLPWTNEGSDVDLTYTTKVLDERHYKMDEVKKRIIEHLAVMKLKKEKQGSIILLVGPPGTGKTSLASSVAKGLNRPYIRVSLGGVKDESEIRGHRRTYVGAMPGKIINGMRKAKANNPVFVLDEIDKLSNSYSGDPASAMLEVLDPEQNSTFVDHYIEMEYDLSQVLFIATANSLATIPRPLLDRMEIIEISSYTEEEKFRIAKDYLYKANLDEHGLLKKQLKVTDGALKDIIRLYTREAGVRGLNKQIAKLCRRAATDIVTGETKTVKIDKKNLNEYLGHKTVRHESIHEQKRAGIATGLAWTPVGGDVLFIEASVAKGNGKLMLTGSLGDVMKESATIALSQVKMLLATELSDIDFNKLDFHIHVPSGAQPKDGPSAGITIFSTLASLMLNKPISNKIAMTGEVTLTGKVLPIGGLKEKAIAAYTAGIKTILISPENEVDLIEVPEEVKDKVEFVLIDDTKQLLKYLFDLKTDDNYFVYAKEPQIEVTTK